MSVRPALTVARQQPNPAGAGSRLEAGAWLSLLKVDSGGVRGADPRVTNGDQRHSTPNAPHRCRQWRASAPGGRTGSRRAAAEGQDGQQADHGGRIEDRFGGNAWPTGSIAALISTGDASFGVEDAGFCGTTLDLRSRTGRCRTKQPAFDRKRMGVAALTRHRASKHSRWRPDADRGASSHGWSVRPGVAGSGLRRRPSPLSHVVGSPAAHGPVGKRSRIVAKSMHDRRHVCRGLGRRWVIGCGIGAMDRLASVWSAVPGCGWGGPGAA